MPRSPRLAGLDVGREIAGVQCRRSRRRSRARRRPDSAASHGSFRQAPRAPRQRCGWTAIAGEQRSQGRRPTMRTYRPETHGHRLAQQKTIEQLRTAMESSVAGTAALRQSLDQVNQTFENATNKVREHAAAHHEGRCPANGIRACRSSSTKRSLPTGARAVMRSISLPRSPSARGSRSPTRKPFVKDRFAG
jgi:hypothetical protein